MAALQSRDEFEAAERRERLRAMRDARYRANLALIVAKLRSLLVTAAILSALIGWPVPARHGFSPLGNPERSLVQMNAP
jgi:hypothetical protein